MVRRSPLSRVAILSLFPLVAAVGCGEDPDNNPPPVGSGSGPNQTTGITSGGSDGSGSDSSSGGTTGGMTVEPEGPGGTCPGHGLFERPITIAPVWRADSPSGSFTHVTRATIAAFTDPGPDAAVCQSQDVRVCVSFENEEDLPDLMMDMQAMQRAACRSLPASTVKQIGSGKGWVDYPNAPTGVSYTVAGASCDFGDSWSQNWPSSNGPTSLEFSAGGVGAGCSQGEFQYVGNCSAQECPIEESGSSGAADGSSGGADGSSGGAGVGSGYDCSMFSSSNVSMSQTRVSPTEYNRAVTIRGALADALRSDMAGYLQECGSFTISPTTMILWDVSSTSLLAVLGVAEDDRVTKVCGLGGDCSENWDEIADLLVSPVHDGGKFEATIVRPGSGRYPTTTIFNYEVTFTAP